MPRRADLPPARVRSCVCARYELCSWWNFCGVGTCPREIRSTPGRIPRLPVPSAPRPFARAECHLTAPRPVGPRTAPWHLNAWAARNPHQEQLLTELATRPRSDAASTPRRNPRGNTRRPAARAPHNAQPLVDGEELISVTGILDVRTDHGFVRVDGYAPGPDDIYLSVSHIRRHDLRSGDII